MEATKTREDQVKLINISGEGTYEKDGKECKYVKEDQWAVYHGNKITIKDILICSRAQAEHILKNCYVPHEKRYTVMMEELPEDQRKPGSVIVQVDTKSAEKIEELEKYNDEVFAELKKLQGEHEELEAENKALKKELKKLKE